MDERTEATMQQEWEKQQRGREPTPQRGDRTPEFVECGGCNCYHPAAFEGDCRDDDNRFASAQLDELYGLDGWIGTPLAPPDTL